MLVQYDGLAERHNSFAATTLTEIAANILNQQKEKEKERKRVRVTLDAFARHFLSQRCSSWVRGSG